LGSEADIKPGEFSKLEGDFPLFFLEMHDGQKKFVHMKNFKGEVPKRRLCESGNKWGKTEIGIAEDLAHSFGCRVWLDENDPDYRIPIRVPNVGLIGCETMAHSVNEKIWPTLKRLIPKTCRWRAKKNQAGSIQTVTLETDPFGNECGSEIYIRSYNEEPDSFEGIDYHWIHWDEPPPKDRLQAAERGKVAKNAPSWFTMTPLKEAYIYDEYSLKAQNNGGDDDQIGVIRGEIWENCLDWCNWCKIDIPENRELNEDYEPIRAVSQCPQCDRTLGFIPKEGIIEYLKTLDPEEREAREKGIWKHLSGLVYKVLDRDIHIYEDFDIPKTWMKIEGIDPHDAAATCYLFGAVSPEEVEIRGKVRNRIYFYDYLLLKSDIDTIVRKIKEKRESHGYSKPKWVVLDQKYGLRTEMEERTWQDELQKRGLGYIRLSLSRPGDVELGHKLVREYLKPHYSTLTGKYRPGMMFARQGCKGSGGPVHHMFNYQYKSKPGQDDPEKQFKDFPDIVRYIALEQPVYKSSAEDAKVVSMLEKRMSEAYKVRRRGVM
jgi:hypothetical protein